MFPKYTVTEVVFLAVISFKGKQELNSRLQLAANTEKQMYYS